MFKNQFEDFFTEKSLKTETSGARHVPSMVSRYHIIGWVPGSEGRKLECNYSVASAWSLGVLTLQNKTISQPWDEASNFLS